MSIRPSVGNTPAATESQHVQVSDLLHGNQLRLVPIYYNTQLLAKGKQLLQVVPELYLGQG